MLEKIINHILNKVRYDPRFSSDEKKLLSEYRISPRLANEYDSYFNSNAGYIYGSSKGWGS